MIDYVGSFFLFYFPVLFRFYQTFDLRNTEKINWYWLRRIYLRISGCLVWIAMVQGIVRRVIDGKPASNQYGDHQQIDEQTNEKPGKIV